MNYAVKFQLLSALLASAGMSLDNLSEASGMSGTTAAALTTPQLSKKSRGALWLVGCQG